MLVKAAQSKGAKLHLEVAASNIAAQRLYSKLGFAQSGLRKAYYAKPSGPAEDAVIMLWKPA
jgi:ribosomal-protein-alanine N-acetyltransferase